MSLGETQEAIQSLSKAHELAKENVVSHLIFELFLNFSV